jgi:predicted GNAT family N-acyltransferase
MDNGRVEVISGADVNGCVSIEQASDIVEILNEATEDKPRTIMDSARGEMALLGIGEMAERLLDEVKSGAATVVLEDGNLAAYTSIFQRGALPDGRVIYEIGNGVTLPRYRGKRYIRKSIETAIASAREMYPHNPISALTKSSSLKRIFDSKGWLQVGAYDFLQFINPGQPISHSSMIVKMKEKSWEKNGWTYYLFDPDGKVNAHHSA